MMIIHNMTSSSKQWVILFPLNIEEISQNSMLGHCQYYVIITLKRDHILSCLFSVVRKIQNIAFYYHNSLN